MTNPLFTSILFSCSGIGTSSYEFSSSGSETDNNNDNDNDNDNSSAQVVDFTPNFFRISEGWFPVEGSSISPEIELQFFEANSHLECSITLIGSSNNATISETMSIQELTIEESNCNKLTEGLISDNLNFSFFISELIATQKDILVESFQKSKNSTFSSFEDRIHGGSCGFFSESDNSLLRENCYFLGYSYTSQGISNTPIRNDQNPDVIRIMGLMSQKISELPQY